LQTLVFPLYRIERDLGGEFSVKEEKTGIWTFSQSF